MADEKKKSLKPLRAVKSASNVGEKSSGRNFTLRSETKKSPVAVSAKSVTSSKTSDGHGHSGLQLYEDDTTTMPTLAAYLHTYTLPGPQDKNESEKRKKVAKLGTMLGVYLPTIQHILGVQMFLRLLWIVGIGGICESLGMVTICCLCTLLTCISISAIATNGVVESGGAYFMISRTLGPEFGTAIGILYYLGNAVAVSMYLVGGVEILLVYMAPDLPQVGVKGDHADELNNFRLYASGLLVIEILVVALGVRFVQCFAPISLACVVLSILAVYSGAAAASESRSPKICLLGERLLLPSAYTVDGEKACNKSALWNKFCSTFNNETGDYFDCYLQFENESLQWIPGIPGFTVDIVKKNLWSVYMKFGESAPGVKGNASVEVVQDHNTDFFIIMAIFFPSVTGIFTGANMSGDLKDPQKSLPVGTLLAQLTTSFIYLSFVVVFGGTIHGALLRDKYGDSLERRIIVGQLGWPHEWVLLIGSFTSTFGAALQCLCSAPRLLQSMASDEVIPFLSVFRVVNRCNEPIRALIVTSFIAEAGILMGSIDDVSPIVDFFFLMCYCFVNVVCVLMSTVLNSPNWRPRFRFYHWSLSLLGALLCLFIMFATYWYYAIVVILLCAGIYKYVEFKGAKKEWGSGINGLALSTAQFSLLRVEESHQHPKNWRPQLLVFVKMHDNEKTTNQKLLQLAGQLKAGKGLTMVVTLVLGDLSHSEDRVRAEKLAEEIKSVMVEAKVKGFTKVVIGEHLAEMVNSTIQCVGIGGLRPNTVIVGWPYRWKESFYQHLEEYHGFIDSIHRAATADLCLIVPKGLKNFPDASDRLTGYIDVWWIMHDGGLLIILPFLLKQHKVWSQCKLRIFAVAQIDDNSVKMKQDLEKWVYQLRIDAVVDVVEFETKAISAYTYERTLLMEERTKLAHELHLSKQDIEHEPQLLVDRHRSRANLPALVIEKLTEVPSAASLSSRPSRSPIAGPVEDDGEVFFSVNEVVEEEVVETVNLLPPNLPQSPTEQISNESEKKQLSFAKLDAQKVKKMHAALKLNVVIKEKSLDSQLVVVNLPRPPRHRSNLGNYMEYLEALTEGLNRVLLVRGSGKEVITIYS